jgi:putative hydrolase of the HAD superfamily
MIRVLIFDLDDTLFPERRFVQSGFKAVDDWLRTVNSIVGFQQEAEAEFNRGIRENIFNLALRSLGVADDPQLIHQMVEVYRDHIPDINLFADVVPALDLFKGQMQFGLLTDGYLNVQKRKVAALGIADRLHVIVYSDAYGRQAWKPSPIPYQQITKLLECLPSECAYVGDNPAKDFVTAKRLNWFTIRVRRPGCEHFAVQLDRIQEADTDIASLDELERALERRGPNRVMKIN